MIPPKFNAQFPYKFGDLLLQHTPPDAKGAKTVAPLPPHLSGLLHNAYNPLVLGNYRVVVELIEVVTGEAIEETGYLGKNEETINL